MAKLPNQDRLDNIAAVARPEEAAVQAKEIDGLCSKHEGSPGHRCTNGRPCSG